MNESALTTLLHAWPLAGALAVLVVAAVLQQALDRIPNVVTYGAIASAWVAAILLVQTGIAPTSGGGLASSMGCTFAALLMLMPPYSMGLVPAGCVKTQAAFAAWVGCAFAFGPAAWIAGLSTVSGLVVTGIVVSLYQIRQATTAQPGDEPIDYTQPPDLFNIQATLTLGSIGGLVVLLIMAVGGAGG